MYSQCRITLLAMLLVGLSTASAFAQTDLSLLMSPWKDGQRLEATFDDIVSPDSSSGLRSELNGEGRLRFDPGQPLSPTAGFEIFHATVQDSALDRWSLSDYSVGGATPIADLGNKWFMYGGAGIGRATAGNESGVNGWYGKATWGVGHALEDSTLLVWLDYDGHRTLFPDIPIPSILYQCEPASGLSLGIGLPSTYVEYDLSARVRLHAQFELPFTVNCSATFVVSDVLTLDLAFEDSEHGFWSASLEGEDRLFFQESKAQGIARWTPSPCCEVRGALGWAFDEAISVGFDDRSQSKLEPLRSGLFLSVGVTFSF